MQNLLIIGNGFDLHHGLKTTYADFLDWASQNDKMGTYNDFCLNAHWWKYNEKEKLHKVIYVPKL